MHICVGKGSSLIQIMNYRHQANTLSNVDLLAIGLLWINRCEICIKYKLFLSKENELECAIYKMLAI